MVSFHLTVHLKIKQIISKGTDYGEPKTINWKKSKEG